jgi:quinol monooxygenase YgiN
MKKFGLYNKFSTVPGKADELADILIKAADLISGAHGCRLYIVNKDQKNSNKVWVTEIWDSEEEHSASLSIEGVKELISEALPLLAGPPEQTKLDVLGGKGI